MTLKQWMAIVDDNPEKLFTEHKAVSYIPLEQKMQVAELAATQRIIIEDDKEVVVEPFCINTDENGYATIDTFNRALFLMQSYLTLYFDVDLSESDYDIAEYNELVAKGYQIRVNKIADRTTTPKVKRRVIEQQNDFKLLEKIINKTLSDEVGRLNDVCRRLPDIIAVAVVDAILTRIETDTTPEKVQEALKELKDLSEQIEKQKELSEKE